MYNPLPSYLTIKDSGIHGLGLFATDDIDADVDMGITHIKDPRFEHGYSRTPLGGFFNHSKNPNCKVIYDGLFIRLVSIKQIMAGEEITAEYTFYDPLKNERT